MAMSGAFLLGSGGGDAADLVEQARRKGSLRRGGGQQPLRLEEVHWPWRRRLTTYWR